VAARLEDDAGWARAVAGCAYVWHVASPMTAAVPRRADDLLRPAVDGTLRVLRAAAASGSVRRVVLTSSTVTVAYGFPRSDTRIRTEDDWADVTRLGAYPRSKFRAERAAWDFVRGRDLELVTIHPDLVLGPLMHAQRTTSLEVIAQLMNREVPAVPRIGFLPADVRDVATAHRLAMQAPHAAGNRYVCVGSPMWLRELAQVLADEFGPRGYRIPTLPLPYPLMWTIGRVNRTVRFALPYVGRAPLASADKAAKELGWGTRPARESIVDAAESMLRYGLVRPPRRG
jgi:nucleoside-diphosphate-sugar epimerase